VYKDSEIKIPESGTVSMTYTSDETDDVEAVKVFHFEGPGVVLGMYNTDESIRKFAKSCFEYALFKKQDLWFSTKDTISKTYDHRFKDIFNEEYELNYKADFERAGIFYFYTLIDDAVARVMKSEGGFIWALKNYDGDVLSDMVSSAFGSLAMMTSVLVSPNGCFEYEAAHGTVQKHYYRHLKGEKTSTNSVATIFAWTGALRKRAELDGNDRLAAFSNLLEEVTKQTIEEGEMTGDLARITSNPNPSVLNSEEFILAIKRRLDDRIEEI
jgi:isocitrate dehydrogenase